MCKNKLKFMLISILATLASINVWAQTCPTDATDTGAAVVMAAFRINPDGTTGAPVGPGSIGICQCVRLRMGIRYLATGPGGKTAFFEGGTMSVRTISGSFTDNVTPGGGVPLIGNPSDPNALVCGPAAVLSFLSDFSNDYCVQPSDITAGGKITFLGSYVGGILHFGIGIPNQPSATTAISVNVNQGPTCTIAPSTIEVCAGSSGTFTASGTGDAPPFAFAWTGPGSFTASGPTITVSVAGTYTATVSDSHGCTSTCTAQLIVNPCGCVQVNPPLVLPGFPQTITVLQLDSGKVDITGPAGGILGDIAIGAGGKLSMSGSQYIVGNVLLGPGATFSGNTANITGTVQTNVDLSIPIAAAYATAAADAALPCTQTYPVLDGKAVTLITGVSGVNVICVKDVSLSGKQILVTGPADASFVFNVTGKFTFTGGGAGPQIRVDPNSGLKSSALLWNIIGDGPDVSFSGGGGGTGCCVAILDGTLLAPMRKIALAPGLVNGEIISGKDISIVSGASVRCPCVPVP
jgi:choice-of-anchor A domain-containing protein